MAKLIFTPLFKQSDLDRMTERFKERTLEKLIKLLIGGGEFFVSHARKNGSYRNRTGNLRSSVGYIVLFNGVPIKMSSFELVSVSPFIDYNVFMPTEGKFAGKKQYRKVTYKGGTGEDGSKAGQEFALDLADAYPTGLVLICLVGMYYGRYIEAMGYDVIKGATIATENYLRITIQSMFKLI